MLTAAGADAMMCISMTVTFRRVYIVSSNLKQFYTRRSESERVRESSSNETDGGGGGDESTLPAPVILVAAKRCLLSSLHSTNYAKVLREYIRSVNEFRPLARDFSFSHFCFFRPRVRAIAHAGAGGDERDR